MPIVNCTNHEILVDLGDRVVAILPSGNMARVVLEQRLDEVYDNVPVYEALPSKVVKGLPDLDPTNLYVVSTTVAQTLRLPNVVCPNHAPSQCTRDHHGQIVSVRSFLRFV